MYADFFGLSEPPFSLTPDDPEPLERWPSANAVVGDGDGMVARHEGVTTFGSTLGSKAVRVP